MKKLIFLFLTFLSASWAFAQVCGTPHPANPTIYSSSARARGASSSFCIDVFFHIARNTNGTNAFTMPNTDDIVERLNEFYNPHNIIINNAGVGFVNDSDLVNISDLDHDRETMNRNSSQTFTNRYGRNGVINYFIVRHITDFAGFAMRIPSDALFIRFDRVLSPISAHELGHCLDLYHTHRGLAYNERGCAEAINDRSNCETCGDLVCDTPADPGLLDNVNSSCVYTGGRGFSPLTNNIMSYSRINCLTDFTNGQGERMRSALASQPVLGDITSTSCVRITAVNTVCYPTTTTISLSHLGGATATWTSSNNVQIVSRNNSSAVIRAVNSAATGLGWVRATLSNGVELTEEFDVLGIPNVNYKYYLQNISLPNNSPTSLAQGAWGQVRVVCTSGCGDLNGGRWEYTATSSSIRNGSNNTLLILPNPGTNRVKISYRSCNDCGCSNWRYKWFDVVPNGLIPTDEGGEEGPLGWGF